MPRGEAPDPESIDKSTVSYDIPDDEDGPQVSRTELVAELRTPRSEKASKPDVVEPPAKDPVEEVPDEEGDLDKNSLEELPYEQDDPDAAQVDAAGELDPDEPVKDNSTASPASDDGQPLILGKFKRQADLETAYNHLERRSSELSNELKQARWQADQAHEQLAKAQQAVSSSPPKLEDLPHDQRDALLQFCQERDLNPNQVLLSAWQVRQAQTAAETAALNERSKMRQREWDRAAQDLREYAGRLDSYGEQAVSELESYPEVFQVLRQLEPEAVDRWGRHYVDLIERSHQYEQLKSELEQREKAAYRRGVKAAQENLDSKSRAGTSASRASTVRTQTSKPPATRSQPLDPVSRLLERRQRQDAAYASSD